jgi:capsular polysaccharide biosynthesis protein
MLYDDGLGLPPADYGYALRIEPAVVPRWDPQIIVADGVRPSQALEILGYRAPAKYTAPEILFSSPQPLLVRGGNFVTVTERRGVVPGSTYLVGDYSWASLFGSAETIELSADRKWLVAGNNVQANHYHWLFQCLSPLLVARRHGLAEDVNLLVPPLSPTRRASLELAGVVPEQIIELPPTAAAVIDRGIYTNLTSGDFAFLPHPAIVAGFRGLEDRIARSAHAGRRVFISRADATARRMVNEAELAAALEAVGFDIVVCGVLSLAEQVALFRDARLIVAQHGAALSNLLFAADGDEAPLVVELHQENYINQSLLKLCQAKRLRYWGVVNPMIDPGADDRHDSTWRADIPAILKLLSSL